MSLYMPIKVIQRIQPERITIDDVWIWFMVFVNGKEAIEIKYYYLATKLQVSFTFQ